MMKEIITGIAIGVGVSAVVGISELATGWISKALSNDSVPTGVIVMADQPCENLGSNWAEFDDAQGRFLIGAGTYNDGQAERTFSLGNQGGTYMHQLTVSELPSHGHMESQVHVTGSTGGRDIVQDQRGVFGGSWRNGEQVLRTFEEGGNIPHNNVPPYVVVNYCVKM